MTIIRRRNAKRKCRPGGSVVSVGLPRTSSRAFRPVGTRTKEALNTSQTSRPRAGMSRIAKMIQPMVVIGTPSRPPVRRARPGHGFTRTV